MTRSIMRSIVRDELRALAGDLLRSWLTPCTRYAWAVYWQRRNARRGNTWRMEFWTRRVARLRAKCDALKSTNGMSAHVVAWRAIAHAERIAA